MIFLFVGAALALEPRETPKFVIDFDLDANVRYDQVYEHFREPLLQMENYWYEVIP